MTKRIAIIASCLTLPIIVLCGFHRTPSSSAGRAFHPEEGYLISVYDGLIRTISERSGNDWRLISAIAYQESRFTPDIVSPRGARGLMQIMPAVARQFDVHSPDDLLDPETSILLANKVLNSIDEALRLPGRVPAKDRMSIALACYNGGIGHVSDARRMARVNGEDPDSWETVSRYLELKADSTYYETDEVRHGRFTGARETRSFVAAVMRRYNRYCAMTE